MQKEKAIIVDIDGTMALRGERDPYDMTRVLEDRPNIAVIEAVYALHRQGYAVIYTSGRHEDARADTVAWLERHARFGYDKLLMRPKKGPPDDEILKLIIYEIMIAPYYDVLCVFDDRDKVVRMWRETVGLPCFQVAPGNF